MTAASSRIPARFGERTGAYPWYVLALLCAAAVSAVLDRFLLSILAQPVKLDLHLTDVQMGVLQGVAFAVFYATLGIPLAHLADRGNRRILIAVGLAVWSIATFAGALASGFFLLLLARMTVGVGEAALNPSAYSLLAGYFDDRRLARVIGIFQSALALSIGLSIVVGGLLFTFFSDIGPQARAHLGGFAPWRLTMMSLAIPGALLAILVILTLREPQQTSASDSISASFRAVWAALSARKYLLLIVILGYCPMSVSGYGQLAWYPSYLIRDFGLSTARAGFVFGTATAVCGVIGPFVGGAISDLLYDRFKSRAPLVVLVWVCAGSLISALGPLMPNVAASIAVFSLGYFIFAMSTPLVATFIQINAPLEVRARVSGVWVCAFNLAGFGLGPLIVAMLTQDMFHRPAAIGLSIAINSAVMLLAAFAAIFAAARLSRSAHG